MFLCKKIMIICMICLVLSANSLPVLALSPGDAIESSGIGTITQVGNLVTIPKTAESNFNTVGKVRWSQFNIPSTQQVDFEFTAAGQTIINFVDPTFSVNPSLIAGQLNTLGTNGICGRVFLINPNGISFDGAQINPDLQISGAGDYNYAEGSPSFLVSSLDLATSFDSINDDSPNIQFDTFTDNNSFANGIFVDDSNFGDFDIVDPATLRTEGTLKELSFIGNGVLIRDTPISVTFDGSTAIPAVTFDNILNVITYGEALVELKDNGNRDLTEINFLANNTVPACTNGTNGGIRYYEFNPASLNITNNLASEFQIAICNDFTGDGNEIRIGPEQGFVFFDFEDGVFNLKNRSDYFNSLNSPSIVKLASRVFINEGRALVNLDREFVTLLTSKNPGQTTATNDPSLLFICPQQSGGSETGIFIGQTGAVHNEVQVTATTGPPDNQVGLLQSGEVGFNQATNRTDVDTQVITLAGANRDVINEPAATPGEPCDPDDCFGTCDTPPDPTPPPGPTPTPDGGGGGAAVAIAVPIGVVGAAGLGSLFAATPLLAGKPQPAPVTTVMRPYYVRPRTTYELIPVSQQTGYMQYPQNAMRPVYGMQTTGAASELNMYQQPVPYYYPQNTGGALPSVTEIYSPVSPAEGDNNTSE